MFPTLDILAYFSPETMMPLTSVIATIVGFALLIKRTSIRFVVHACRSAIRTGRNKLTAGKPHLASRSGQPSEKSRI